MSRRSAVALGETLLISDQPATASRLDALLARAQTHAASSSRSASATVDEDDSCMPPSKPPPPKSSSPTPTTAAAANRKSSSARQPHSSSSDGPFGSAHLALTRRLAAEYRAEEERKQHDRSVQLEAGRRRQLARRQVDVAAWREKQHEEALLHAEEARRELERETARAPRTRARKAAPPRRQRPPRARRRRPRWPPLRSACSQRGGRLLRRWRSVEAEAAALQEQAAALEAARIAEGEHERAGGVRRELRGFWLEQHRQRERARPGGGGGGGGARGGGQGGGRGGGAAAAARRGEGARRGAAPSSSFGRRRARRSRRRSAPAAACGAGAGGAV